MRLASLADYEQVKRICMEAGGSDPLQWLSDPRNIILLDGENCVLFLWRWIGIYEGHVLFTNRGRAALDLGAQCLDFMFSNGAGLILAVISHERPHASWFVRKLGFRRRGEIETIEGPSEMYQLEAAQCQS